MIDSNRPVGLDPAIEKPVIRSSTTPTTTAPLTVETPKSDLKPIDTSTAQSGQTTSLSLNIAGFQDLPEATTSDTNTFLRAKQDHDFTSLSIVGNHVLVAASGHVIKMKRADVEEALKSGQLGADSKLTRALVVHEAAAKAGLSAGATRAIMSSYLTALKDGNSTQNAQTIALTNISTAVQVEMYVSHKEGLASDLRRVAEFTSDAFGDKNTKDIAQIRNKTLKAEVIKQHQGYLDTNLHAFSDAFATARETGDYGAAFDKLQTFFKVSAEVTATPYWQNRPNSLLSILTPPTPSSKGPDTSFVELLHLQNAKPKPKLMKIDESATSTAVGGFFTDLKARFLNWRGKGAEPVSAKLAPEAAHKVMVTLANAGDTVVTGKLWKAPPPPPPLPEEPPTVADKPKLPETSVTRTEDDLTMGVPDAPVTGEKGQPSFIERKLKEQLSGMRTGNKLDLGGSFGASIGIEINAIDFIPVAGEALSEVGGLKASLGASVGAEVSKGAEITLLEDGKVSVRVTTETSADGSVSGSLGSKTAGLSVDGKLTGKLGHRAIVDMTFNSAADAAAWLAHPLDHGGIEKATTVGAGTFTVKARSETYDELTTEAETTRWISSKEKSSLSKLPGIRTQVTTETTRSVETSTSELGEELEFRLSTYAGKSSEAPIASQVNLTAIKRLDADGKPTFEAPTLELGLNIQKVMNMVKHGTTDDGKLQATAAREIILEKMTDRVLQVLKAGNAQGFGGKIDVADVRTKLDAALRTLQAEADTMFAGQGVTQQSQLGLLGLTLLRGDIAKIDFKLEKREDGTLTIGAPNIGVESTTKLKFKLAFKEIVKVEASAEAVATRDVSGPTHTSVMPRTEPTDGTNLSIHTADAGYLYGIQKTDSSGHKTLSEPRVALKMDYDTLAMILDRKGTPAEHNAAISQVMDNLIDDLGAKAKAEGLDGEFDRAKCLEAFKQAIMVAGMDYDNLKTGKDKSNYTIPFEDFAISIGKKTYKPLSNKVMFAFQVEKDSTGKLSLKPPLDVESTAEFFKDKADYEAALTKRKAAEVSPSLDVHTKHEGFMKARMDHEGVRVPIIGLNDKVDTMFEDFDTQPTQPQGSSARVPDDPDHGVKNWANKMLAKLKTKVLKPATDNGQFTGQFDDGQMRATLINAGKALKAMRAKLASLGEKEILVEKGLGMEIQVEPRNRWAGGHKVTLKFQAVQEKDEPTHWKLPTGNLGDTRESPSLVSVSRELASSGSSPSPTPTMTPRDRSAPVDLPT
jgi:hypothetical protein